MKLLDANVLLYAYDSGSAHHGSCRAWLEATLNGEEIVAIPWQTVLAFVRIASNSRAVPRPISALDACAVVAHWLARPNVVIVGPEDRFWELFRALIAEAQVSGALVTDATLAALALENGATLCSTDRDFRRFQGLRLLDPTTPLP